MCRSYLAYNECAIWALEDFCQGALAVFLANKKNLPTPFGMFLEVETKPARECWPLHQILYCEAFKVLGDRLEAEDAGQNLYVRLWKHFERFL